MVPGCRPEAWASRSASTPSPSPVRRSPSTTTACAYSRSGTPQANGGLSVSSNATATSFRPNTAPNTTFAPNMLQPSQGGGFPHENQQPYLGLNFCIALQGIYPSFP